MMRLLGIFFFSYWLLACGVQGEVSSRNDIRNPLNLLLKSENVLSSDLRLPAYSRVAGRVSMIDPIRAVELWGRDVGYYQNAIPLADSNGMALINNTELNIVTEQASKTFALEGGFSQVASARNSASYAFLANDLGEIELVHTLGGGNWQQQRLSLPWGLGQQSNGAEIFFDDAGRQLFAVNLQSGHYAVFTTDTAGRFAATPQLCDAHIPRSFRHAAWVESDKSVAMTTANGEVYMFNSENCLAAPAVQQFTPAVEVVNYAEEGPGRLLLTQLNGDVWSSEFGVAGFTNSRRVLVKSCPVAIGALPLQAQYILLVCTQASNNQSRVGEFFGLNSVLLEYRVYDRQTQDLQASLKLYLEESAGSGISPQSAQLFRAKDSSLGELQIYNLLNGESVQKKGIYLGNLF